MYSALIWPLLLVIMILMRKDLYKPAKKWIIAGLLGFDAAILYSINIPVSKILLGVLVIVCAGLLVVGAEKLRKNRNLNR